MKKLLKVLAGVFVFTVVLAGMKVSAMAKETLNVSTLVPEVRYLSSGGEVYNDTGIDVWIKHSDDYFHGIWYVSVYTSDANGGTKTAPGKKYKNSYAIGVTLNVTTNEALGNWVTIKYGNGQDDTKQYVLAGGTMVEPEDPVWDGYEFLGWYIDSDYSEKFDFSTPIEQETSLYAKWREKSSGKTVPFREASSYVDHDTFKSEMPSKTILAASKADEKDFMDMKIHATDATNNANQRFLAKQLVGNNATELITKDIFPRRDLSITENGEKRILIWNNLDIKMTGIVKAVVYNQTDGAYVINGVSDGNGTVKFVDFILRPASTITVIAP